MKRHHEDWESSSDIPPKEGLKALDEYNDLSLSFFPTWMEDLCTVIQLKDSHRKIHLENSSNERKALTKKRLLRHGCQSCKFHYINSFSRSADASRDRWKRHFCLPLNFVLWLLLLVSPGSRHSLYRPSMALPIVMDLQPTTWQIFRHAAAADQRKERTRRSHWRRIVRQSPYFSSFLTLSTLRPSVNATVNNATAAGHFNRFLWRRLERSRRNRHQPSAVYASIPPDPRLFMSSTLFWQWILGPAYATHAQSGNSSRSFQRRLLPRDRCQQLEENLVEFHSLRHLSRYEVQYRQQHQLPLDPDWNGLYQEIHSERPVGIDASPVDAALRDSNATFHRARRRQLRRRGNRDLDEDAASQFGQYATGADVPLPLPPNEEQRADGGVFDSYQAVPLSQGYGTHYANVWVGSPQPQRKTVIVDTGSHYTAFPCEGCRNCGRPHHTDPYFTPAKSSTFHLLQCDECEDGVACVDGRCKFSQKYTEGSSWEAVQVQDRFYCGGTDVLTSIEPEHDHYALNFMFGCQTSMEGLFVTQLADGIMGMSAHQVTLPKQMYDQGLLEHNMFGLCYRRELGTSRSGVLAGSMTLGGFSNHLDTGPMVFAKNMVRSGWYTVYVKAIYVRSGGGQSAYSHDPLHKTIKVRMDPATLNSGKGVIVDSGTTDTYLNKQVLKEFNKAWMLATGSPYTHRPISLSKEQLERLPTILVQCQAASDLLDPSIANFDSLPGYTGILDPDSPSDLLIAIPATSYMDWSPITRSYSSRVYFTESKGGVLGSNSMTGHNVLFDWENGRVGFAESTCTYDKKGAPAQDEYEGYPPDCRLGKPILTTACIDTVERSLCKHNPSNIALLGTERWSAIVESPGTDAGMTCLEVAKGVSSVVKGDQDSITACDGQGICEESRPCQLTCGKAAKDADVVRLPDSDARHGKCAANNLWSACDHSCVQSRILSAAFSDGLCHELSRESRPCHVASCGRTSPCRVPFIVHGVIGLRGVEAARWTRFEEDRFVSAFSDTAAKFQGARKPIFEPGDVRVQLVYPWSSEDDNFFDGDQLSDPTHSQAQGTVGMKVVLEISIFNRLSSAPNATVVVHYNEKEVLNPFHGGARNFTRAKGKDPRVRCNPDQLFPLARDALDLKASVLSHDQFVSTLVAELRAQDRLLNRSSTSPYRTLYDNSNLVKDSRLLAAWTIRTEIDDEINYFGPPRPMWHRLVILIHILTLTLLGALLLASVCCFVFTVHESIMEEHVSVKTATARSRFSCCNALHNFKAFLISTGRRHIHQHRRPVYSALNSSPLQGGNGTNANRLDGNDWASSASDDENLSNGNGSFDSDMGHAGRIFRRIFRGESSSHGNGKATSGRFDSNGNGDVELKTMNTSDSPTRTSTSSASSPLKRRAPSISERGGFNTRNSLVSK
jgi:Xylanase inhibitor N-terminal